MRINGFMKVALTIAMGWMLGCGGGGGSSAPVTPPVVPAFTTTPLIAAGDLHTLALKSDGSVWAWGNNDKGQLGLGTDGAGSPVPAKVVGLEHIVQIASRGRVNAAVKDDGTVYTWGSNEYGKLGMGSDAYTTFSSTPKPIPTLSKVKAVAVGHAHLLALKTDGTVWAWGDNNYGEIGNGGTSGVVNAPVQVPGLATVTAIAAGGTSSAALKANGYIYTWGENSVGQLGDGTTKNSPVPVEIQPGSLMAFKSVCMGRSHVSAIAGDYSDVLAWGYNDHGQIGDGSTTTRTAPVNQPTAPSGWTQLAASENFTLALSPGGKLFGWGDGQNGQLGYTLVLGNRVVVKNHVTPRVILVEGPAATQTFTTLAGGGMHAVAISADGQVWTWGNNSLGQLGRTPGTDPTEPDPTVVPGFRVKP